MTYTTNEINGREFDINQPSDTPTKVVIFLHGFGGNKTEVAAKLGNPDPDNYYMVFPNGRKILNDDTKLKWSAAGGWAGMADAAFLGRILEHLEGLGVTDIYIAGHSNGAVMAAYMVAKYPDYIRGALFISGYLDNNVGTPEGGDIEIRHIHGIKDNLVKLTGANYTLEDHLNKFIDAGHFVSAELLPYGHNLEDLNQNDLIINEIKKLIGV